MSDEVTCEHCGREGRRLRGHVAPEGWYFGSFMMEDENHDPGDLLIVSACSEACRNALWTKMEGHRWDAIERRIDVPTELRRGAHLHKQRLRKEAQRIRLGAWPCDGTSAGEAFAEVLERTAEALALETERKITSLAARSDDDAPTQEIATVPPLQEVASKGPSASQGLRGVRPLDNNTQEITNKLGTIYLTRLRHIVQIAVLMELQPGRETWHPDKRAHVVANRVIDQLSMPKEPLGEDDEPPLSGGCPVHYGAIHGGEAKELRKGLARLIKIDRDDLEGMRHKMQQLLDHVDARDSLAHLESSAIDRDTLQARVFIWCKGAFGLEKTTNLQHRGLRLLEEAIELFQAADGLRLQAHNLIDHVFDQPPGVLHQELGGIGVAVLAMAAAAGLSADACERGEVMRVLGEPLEYFSRRDEAKDAASFPALPREDGQ